MSSSRSRGLSRNVRPKTERTLLTTVKFYHAALCRPGEPVLDLIVAEREVRQIGHAPDFLFRQLHADSFFRDCR